ncbi:MAG: C40 family peptidase [Pseudomonas sp.]
MRSYVLISLFAAALLSGCSSTPTTAPIATSPSAAAPARADVTLKLPTRDFSGKTLPTVHTDVIFQAISLVGTPYRYGGSTPDTGFDCSGLINYVYREAAGVDLPRTTAGLSAMSTKKPSASNLQPGDLVLFATNSRRRVDHAGIYVGDGRFLHAPSSGGKVRVDSLQASYWQRAFTGARRVLD